MSFVPPDATGNSVDEPLEMEVVATAPPPMRAGELIAWFAIVGFTMLLFVANLMEPHTEEDLDFDSPPMEVLNSEVVGKFAYTLRDLSEQYGGSPQDSLKLIQEMDSGSLEQRYCMILALNDMESSVAAFKKLDELDELVAEQGYKPNERQVRLRDLVEQVLVAHEEGTSPSLSEDDRKYLMTQLRWFGRLALNPRDGETGERKAVIDEAWWTSGLLLLAGMVAMLLLICGLIGLIALFFLTVSGRIQSEFQPGSGAGPIYAETFAIWLVGFFAAQLALGFLLQRLNLGLQLQMASLPLVFFLSLAALVWPVIRGVSFAQVRSDIGWTIQHPIGDVSRGVVAYSSATPLMGVALLATVFVLGLFSPFLPETNELAGGQAPAHPVVGYIASGDSFVIAMIFMATCIAAPIVEETMFRGVLFRSLRDRTSGWSSWASVLFSAGLNSLVFAAIHPQGLVGIPVLMMLAIAFSLVRQWRNSLVGPIFMHGLNNFLVTTLAVVLMS